MANISFSVLNKINASFVKKYNWVEKLYQIQPQRSRMIIWFVVIIVLFCISLLLNSLTPLLSDDFGYMFIYGTNVKVHSFTDIIQSQINHYYLWGGRAVVHVILQALLLLPNWAIDLLNSLMYICFITLVYKLIIGRGKNSISLFILLVIAIWFLLPSYGDSILWITGSANYLWGTSIVLTMMLPYRFYGGGKNGKLNQILPSIGMLLLGVLAGWTNENTAAAMLIILVQFFIYYKCQNWTIPVWAVTGFLGGMIGYILMIKAPGNFVRAGEAVFFSPFLFLYRLLNYTKILFLNYGVFNMFYVGLIVLYFQFVKQNKVQVLTFSFIYLVGLLVSIYVMLFSPSFPSRAWFGPVIFNIIAAGIIFYNLDYEVKYLRQIKYLIMIIGVIMFSFSLYDALKDIMRFNRISKERQMIVEKAKQHGEKQCEFMRYHAFTKFSHTEEPTSNCIMSEYYGVVIKFKDEK